MHMTWNLGSLSFWFVIRSVFSWIDGLEDSMSAVLLRGFGLLFGH